MKISKALFIGIISSALMLSACTPGQDDQGNTPDQGGNNGEPVACTQDSKLCPDGSYVGRVAPSCEFEQCTLPEGWENYSGDGFSYSAPSELGSQYAEFQTWPPEMTMEETEFVCNGEGTPFNSNGHHYCLTIESEGTAGSEYQTYNYLRDYPDEGKVLSITYVIRLPQCENYDEPEQTDCWMDQSVLDLDTLTVEIAESVEFGS